MNAKDYEQKKRECWEQFCRHIVDEEEEFYNMFDRAYALGKQEKDAEKANDTMKARRKSDGEIIEIKEWRGASDVVYSSLDMNQFYQASDLDFNLDAEGTVIRGWVARDDGERWHERELHLFTRNKPERRKLMGDWIGLPSMTLDSNLFPDLTWDSEPIEVELIIKRKKNGYSNS